MSAHLPGLSGMDRVPSGVPTGGQFATTTRGEAEVSLSAQPSGNVTDPCWGCGEPEHEPQGAYPDLHVYRPCSEALAAMEREDYDVARKKVDHAWNLLTDNIEMLPDEKREERYLAVAEHFEATALSLGTSTPVEQVPRYGETLLNGHTGAVYAAADYAARARLNAGYGAFRVADIDAGGDALAQRAFDTRAFTTAREVPMRARIVRKGTPYGREGRLMAAEDKVVFFDARFPDHPPMVGTESEERAERNGQHIATYDLRTLLAGSEGLNLHGGEPDWSIDAATYSDVRAWLNQRSR